MHIIASTVGIESYAEDTYCYFINTIVAALLYFLHIYEHVEPLVEKLRCLLPQQPTKRLEVELLQKISRI